MNNLKVGLEGAAKVVPRNGLDALRDVLHPVTEAAVGVEDRPVGALVEEELKLALHRRLQTANEGGAAGGAAEEAAFSADKVIFLLLLIFLRLGNAVWIVRRFFA